MEPNKTAIAEINDIPHNLHEFIYYSKAYGLTTVAFLGILINSANLYILKQASIGKRLKICLLVLTVNDLCACILGLLQLLLETLVFQSEIPFGHLNILALINHLSYYVYLIFMCSSGLFLILVAFVRTVMISS